MSEIQCKRLANHTARPISIGRRRPGYHPKCLRRRARRTSLTGEDQRELCVIYTGELAILSRYSMAPCAPDAFIGHSGAAQIPTGALPTSCGLSLGAVRPLLSYLLPDFANCRTFLRATRAVRIVQQQASVGALMESVAFRALLPSCFPAVSSLARSASASIVSASL